MLRNIQLRRARLAAAAAVQAAAGPPRAGAQGLEVADVRAFAVREPVSRRAYTILKVQTRSGLAGYGECPSAAAADVDGVRQELLGKTATAYEVIGRQLAAPAGLKAAIDMALLDITGKAAKAPVYQVLGGPTRFKARALARLSGDSDAALAADLRRAMAAGFRAFLAPLPPMVWRNQGQGFVVATRKRMDALRAAGGENTDLVLDGAGSLTPGDAGSLAEAFEKFHLLWFDEPCPLANLGAVKKIAAENVTPLGFGRNIEHGGAFQDLLREDAIDVIRPDIGRNGISRARRMSAIAETYYVAVAPYHEGGPVGTVAALHLAASIPNFYIQQIPLPQAEEDRRMRAEIAGPSAEAVKDGFAELPAGPGLGITVNEEALAKYRERAA